MANFASALKEEISRIARKEVRQQTTGAAKSVAQCEREIAALKRQIAELQRKLSPSPAQAAPKAGTSRKAPSSKAPNARARVTRASESKAASTDKPGKAAVAAPAPVKKAAPAKKTGRVRFSAKGLKANRERLGLSADNYGKLVGVSGLSIYNWEQGKARPRESSIEALLKIRGIGKREAANRLQAIGESASAAKTEAKTEAKTTAKKSAGSGEKRSKGTR